MNNIDKNEVFIEKARKVHGDKYNYSKVEYVNSISKIIIVCPLHGEFYQTPNGHLSGQGCNECNKSLKKDKDKYLTKTFISIANDIHNNKYDYSKTESSNSQNKVCIICPIHGEFWQKSHNHLKGSGCKQCGINSRIIKKSSDNIQFILNSKEVHGNKYDYSKVEYVRAKSKVSIICPIHGKFEQNPCSHLSGQGCNECGRIRSSEKQSSDTPTFIEKSKEVHGDKYNYSKVEYVNNHTKISIICPIHGEFHQTPHCHLGGKGCKKCGIITHIEKNSSDTATFIEKARKIHGDKYDYSKVEYINAHSKICIICPIHGEFYQRPYDHIGGVGCEKCGILSTIEKLSSDTPTFIGKARKVHGDRYDYSKVEYVNNRTKVCIICSIHGEFWQESTSHLKGCGCNECGQLLTNEKLRSNTPTFIERGKEIHGDKYDYSKVEYIGANDNVNIICPIHGEFHQTPHTHLNGGQGCPKCVVPLSKPEIEIGDYIESIGMEVIRGNRKILSGLELDIYIPSKNIAIEYNGLYWHSEEQGKDKNYHLNKTLLCKEKGIGLIHIFEDEYLSNKELVLNKLKHILNVQDSCPRIMGRKCKIEVIGNDTAKSFLNTYHIQGYASSIVHLGAVYGNELIAVMSFKKVGKESLRWELTRFASNSTYICQGIGGKLFKYFIKNYNPSEVKSFADRRWVLNEEDNLYTKLDFYLVSVSAPKYSYLVRHKRIDKRFSKKLNSSLDTLSVSKLHKIWDCGLFKYIWKREESS